MYRSVEILQQTKYTLTFLNMNCVQIPFRHIPSLGPVLILVALNNILPAVVRAHSEGTHWQ